jgi:two-component system, cell cycle response regulator DivK
MMFHESHSDVSSVLASPTHAASLRVVGRSRAPLILLVDDDQDVRKLLTTILRSAAYRVGRACDGVEALYKAWHLGPSVVVMDLCLPRLDGCSVIRWLKSDPRTHHIPIVAVTGYRVDDDASTRARAAGCDAFFEKPLPMRRFLACVRRLAYDPANRKPNSLRGSKGASLASHQA